MPLYKAFSSPNMLPTSTLNPLVTATAGAKNNKVKRNLPIGINNILSKRTPQQQQADRWWWLGVFLTASGGILYCLF